MADGGLLAWVQVEGVLTQQPGGSPLIKFVHRRRNSGLQTSEISGFWRLDSSSPADPGLSGSIVGLLIRRIAYEILMELDQHLNRPE